jgi:hypothetical protein
VHAIFAEAAFLAGKAIEAATDLQRMPGMSVAVLELIAMLFQDDTHQLTARPDAGLREELLKCSFD